MVASVAVVPDDPMATSILTFTQTLMSSVSLPVARSVFHNQLSTNLRSLLPAAGTALLVQSGATGFRKHLTSSLHLRPHVYGVVLYKVWSLETRQMI